MELESQATAKMINKTLRLWYDEAAPDSDEGWTTRSLPLGNGYMGVNVFGIATKERLQITENSLLDLPDTSLRGGLNNFAEVFLDFDHDNVTNYTRELSLNDALSTVTYTHSGVDYTREYFTSYPDKVLVIRLSASQAGALSFTLRPTIPYRTTHRFAEDDDRGKSGTVKALGDTITLNGLMHYYGIQFEGQFKVIPTGGSLHSSNDDDDDNGTVTVSNADSAVIIVAVGTNYRFDPQVNSAENRLDKLAGFAHPHAKVTQYIAAAAQKTYSALLATHRDDYRELFDRARIDLGGLEPTVTTDALIGQYRDGQTDRYLEELAFAYGRYLLISSSRTGALPPHLQGVWNVFQDPPWTSGYWHNINQQMNYWPAMNTNLAELFLSYVDYARVYLPRQKQYGTEYVTRYHPAQADPDGDNGWAFGTSSYPYTGSGWHAGTGVPTHSGFGTAAWTAQMFWDYYDFTRDQAALESDVYPMLHGASNFLSRMVETVDGKLLLSPSASPEHHRAGTDSYLITKGATFDQQMTYENHRNTLAAAHILGKPSDAVLAKIATQLPLLDPIKIGKSGQIKEFREEEYYGDLVAEPNHRHASHLLGHNPGQVINSTTPAWQDAVKVSLARRGTSTVGFTAAERMNQFARAGEPEQAYGELNWWLRTFVMDNLFSSSWKLVDEKLFTIDANFGATAGIAEMLLQSHDAAIAPLPAIPVEWSAGRYEGLTARGNFEVSAAWANGQASWLEVTSRSGGTAQVRYPNIGRAIVETAAGAHVAYTTQLNGDQISFPTTAGTTYVITAIPPHAKVAAPKNLTVVENLPASVRLSWPASPTATSYSVYRAVGDSPTYEPVATGISGTGVIDSGVVVAAAEQITYRVVAIGADGREGPGATTIRLHPMPADAGDEVAGSTRRTGSGLPQ
ncbi:glycosyl hydrolase family 95 catalytic domain-containing protein [Microbacterium sulfonylureivorans]|uniref:glycoside hydrolase family 95 protein n=1 Tax=Microbacterium sulfonylureivorans TaxID=2486854 RepID=UPI000FDB4959|nr:glycoside hydrolase family 95 protein [Microbacterium sulfonylureivorans]